MPRPKLRNDELRAHILKVACELLEREGLSEFTARGIAQAAGTSMPAVYELFGHKGGLLREVFFEGFRELKRAFDQLEESADPGADLGSVLHVYRAFIREHPRLTDLMFSQPFAAFDPGPDELEAGAAVRRVVMRAVRRCIDHGTFAGDATDIAHVLVALAQGLAAQERAGWLGTSKASIDRRWRLAIRMAIQGFAP